MTSGPSPRPLITLLTSVDALKEDVGTALRAALDGIGPILALRPEPDRRHIVAQPTRTTPSPSAPPAPLVPAAPGRDVPVPDDPADPTAVALATSGSGGTPKTVLLSASALLASAAATHDRLGGPGHWLLAVPAHHVAGLQVLVRSLVAGTRPAVLDLGAGFTPAAFAEAATRVGGRPGARRYTSLVPTQLTRLLGATGPDADAARAALRGFDAVLAGGASVTPSLRERAEAEGVRLVATYGMTETCGGCVYDGQALDGVRLRLEAGRVLIGGPVLARGYLGDPEGTAAAFLTDPDGTRWLRTEDAGRFENGELPEDGGPPDDGAPVAREAAAGDRLRILGRLDAMIITGGVNVAPEPVEAALQRLPGVAEAAVVGLPDPEWGQRVAAALVLDPGAVPPSLAAVRELVGRQLTAPAAPRQLTVLEELPLRGPGKPDRAAIAAVLADRPPRERI